MTGWPSDPDALVTLQRELATRTPPLWEPTAEAAVGASYVCFGHGPHDRGWAGAALKHPRRRATTVVVAGRTEAAYLPGLLALREGPLREAAVRALPRLPGVLLIDATGRDHPRRAGLALHLGAVLDVPTIGITNRPLAAVAAGHLAQRRGATTALLLQGLVVGYLVRSRAGVRPVAVSAGWRTDPDTAVDVVLRHAGRHRTPQPLREARRAARQQRARDSRNPRS